MSKHQKALERLQAQPPPADITWAQLRAVLTRLGYEMRSGQGSRRKFYHKDKDILISCHEPHPRPQVDRGCIADIVDHLKTNGLI